MRSLHDPRARAVPSRRPEEEDYPAMVFGKRDTKPDALTREDVVGNLYPDTLSSEVDVTPSPTEFRRGDRSEEHTSELQSPMYLVCRLLLEKKKNEYYPP